jgi:hypothetical protein
MKIFSLQIYSCFLGNVEKIRSFMRENCVGLLIYQLVKQVSMSRVEWFFSFKLIAASLIVWLIFVDI